MASSRKVYSQAFKDEACKLVMEQGYSPHKAAEELGVTSSTLDYWLAKRGYKSKAVEHVPPDSDDPVVLKTRIRELEKTLARAQMEKDILKKATAYFASQNP